MKIVKSIRKIHMNSRWIYEMILMCVIIGTFVMIFNYNNFILVKFSSQLFEMDLPEDVSVIEKVKLRGKLNGNGNGMDFFACILVKTERSLEELDNYLNEQEFIPAKNHEIVDVEVVKLKSNQLETEYVEHEEVMFDNIKNEIDFDNYFVLLIYDGGYSADFDILGH